MRLLTSASEPVPAAKPLMPPTARTLQWVFGLGVLALYGGAIAVLGGLAFDPVKDEEQFWTQVTAFAQGFPPSIEQLRTYEEPMTPVAFLVWAALESWQHLGIAAGRFLTLAASLGVLALIALRHPAPGDRPETPVLAALGLLLYPYWLPTSLLVYTDVPASFFLACGLFFYVRGQHAASACLFAVAIATRQYMVTFPAAILAYEGLAAWRAGAPLVTRWAPHALAVATLFGWFAFFGGFGPAPSLEKWPRHSSALVTLQPAYALYALAAIGAYFVALEFVLFRGWRTLSLRIDRRTGLALALTVLLFGLFTPYYSDQIGILNRGLDYVFGTGPLARVVRIALLLGFACATVLRFSRLGLGAWVVAANVAIMPLVWSPWEKYYMPTLAALWFLKAAGALDEPAPARADALPRAAAGTPGETSGSG